MKCILFNGWFQSKLKVIFIAIVVKKKKRQKHIIIELIDWLDGLESICKLFCDCMI